MQSRHAPIWKSEDSRLHEKLLLRIMDVKAQVDAAKSALTNGNASLATVETFRCLLWTEPPESCISTEARTTSRPRPTGCATARSTAAKRTEAKNAIRIKNDIGPRLPPKDQQRLATEIVNISLRYLSEPRCVVEAGVIRSASLDIGRDGSVTQTSTITRRPLGQTSGNSGSPKTSSRNSGTTDVTSKPSPSNIPASVSAEAVAQCAMLAFATLRSIEAKHSGSAKAPKLQLETGMLALTGKMISFGLYSLARKELQVVRDCLEEAACVASFPGQTKKSSRPPALSADNDSPASLLKFKGKVADLPDVIPLLGTYHLHVLRVIAAVKRPPTIAAVADVLHLNTLESPVQIILQQLRQGGNKDKVARQLSTLSGIILSMCPSTNTSEDDDAANYAESVAPIVIFRLQALALKLRRLWWNLAGHQANVEKELIEPFARCITVLLRRNAGDDPLGCYEVIYQSLESLELSRTEAQGTGTALLSIYRTLSSLSQANGDRAAEARWAQAMVEDCLSLSSTHARRIEALCRLTVANLRAPDHKRDCSLTFQDLDKICTLLGEQLTGNRGDYEELLVSLVQLIDLSHRRDHSPSSILPTLLQRAAGYAQRFAKSYPNRKSLEVLSIVRASLLHSETTEALLGWLSKQTVAVFVQDGILKNIAAAARLQPLHSCFTVSPTTIAFGKAVNGLVLKALRSDSDAEFLEVEQLGLTAEEELCLLEWQLHCIVGFSRRGKYQTSLSKVLSKTYHRISQIYRLECYPIREARTALQVLSLKEAHPDLVSNQISKSCQDVRQIEQKNLGQDHGLAAYTEETNAAFILMRAFAAGTISVEDLRQPVAVWTSVLAVEHSDQSGETLIYDADAFRLLLSSVAAYLGMVGSDPMRHRVLILLHRLSLLKGNLDDQLQTSTNLALQSLRLGYLNRASSMLQATTTLAGEENAGVIQRLQLHVAYGEYYLQSGDLVRAAQSLDDARALRTAIEPKQLKRHERQLFETMHPSAWFLQSRFAMVSGNTSAALEAARQSVKLWHSIWASLERRQTAERGGKAVETPSNSVDGLVAGVSKLTLGKPEPTQHGAAFWTLVTPMCEALVQLSKLYAHHGLFLEAKHYCERGISIAGGCNASNRLTKILCYKARLDIKAGHLEDAELSLARMPSTSFADGILEAEIHRARAELRWAEGAYDDAVEQYEQAESILSDMERERTRSDIAALDPAGQLASSRQRNILQSTVKSATAKRQPEAVATKRAPGRSRQGTAVTSAAKMESTSSEPSATAHNVQSVNQISSTIYAHSRTSLMLDKALCAIQAGKDHGLATFEEGDLSKGLHVHRYARLLHQQSMRQMDASTKKDVSLSMLLDSALAWPSCRSAAGMPAPQQPDAQPRTTTKSKPAGKKPVKPKTGKVERQQPVTDNGMMTSRVPNEVIGRYAALRDAFSSATWEMHSLVQMRSARALVRSAFEDHKGLDPASTQSVFEIELGRSTALHYEQYAVALDRAQNDVDQQLQWPSATTSANLSRSSNIDFQREYIDILPKPWTAISMTLSDNRSELFVTRYRSHESPFMVRLPFARHHGEDEVDEQAFDFAAGKAELLDIIQLSNTSCHNGTDMTKKGAKTGWWSEREALDRRMHELLLNMERIWFGGFKGLLSDYIPQADLMASFRRSFDGILQRHLPSRKNARGQPAFPELDDRIFGLFINLGSDQDSDVDLDEALIDLLYFVVDTLQFRGERNAYDEIDFDNMVLELLEALREYHEASERSLEHDRHVVLILDRRLQAFPWESLPCLQSVSVSRVGSMLALRDCIATMSDATSHHVDRTAGTIFLNPSGDLSGTQTILEPTLSTLLKAQPNWTALNQTAPDEETFSRALSDSSITLYFGHGAGSQYIRPRTIKKLDRCSEVVWLMGCSSGAVTEYGQLEPFAVPHAYLLAGTANRTHGRVEGESQPALVAGSGTPIPEPAVEQAKRKCLAVVATLWDVTDKDIDRFSLEVGDRWGLWSRPNESSSLHKMTATKRQRAVLPSTPTQVPKTPKTPKVAKSVVPKTPVRIASRRSRSGSDKKCSLVEAVSRSRDACYLRYLNGASPVVYGVPVYLGD